MRAIVYPIIFYHIFLSRDLLHAKLNNHYEALSYEKSKKNKIKTKQINLSSKRLKIKQHPPK